MRLIDADAFKMEDFRHCLDCDSIIQVIKYAPTIEVEPVKHGRWENAEYWKSKGKQSILYKTNRCSLCHCDISNRLSYNYCPNCGAKMGGDNS